MSWHGMLTPTGSNTQWSIKCANCGVMYAATGEPGEDPRMVSSTHCPSCGMDNHRGSSREVDASDEDY